MVDDSMEVDEEQKVDNSLTSRDSLSKVRAFYSLIVNGTPVHPVGQNLPKVSLLLV